MRSPYQRAMLFLTYIQGTAVTEWVGSMVAWLRVQVDVNGRDPLDNWLWYNTHSSFMRQYADTLKEEKAQTELRKGIRMERGDIDAYVAKFEQLVRYAGYNIDQPMVLDLCANGLPNKLQETIYLHDNPVDYEDWKRAAIKRQGQYLHLRNKIDQYKIQP